MPRGSYPRRRADRRREERGLKSPDERSTGARSGLVSSPTSLEFLDASRAWQVLDTGRRVAKSTSHLYFSSPNPCLSIAMKRLFKDSASVGWAKTPSRITV